VAIPAPLLGPREEEFPRQEEVFGALHLVGSGGSGPVGGGPGHGGKLDELPLYPEGNDMVPEKIRAVFFEVRRGGVDVSRAATQGRQKALCARG
jgi:hypothetical protein